MNREYLVYLIQTSYIIFRNDCSNTNSPIGFKLNFVLVIRVKTTPLPYPPPFNMYLKYELDLVMRKYMGGGVEVRCGRIVL